MTLHGQVGVAGGLTGAVCGVPSGPEPAAASSTSHRALPTLTAATRRRQPATLFESESSNYCAPELTCSVERTIIAYAHSGRSVGLLSLLRRVHCIIAPLTQSTVRCLVKCSQMMGGWTIQPTNAGEVHRTDPVLPEARTKWIMHIAGVRCPVVRASFWVQF